MSHQVLYRLTAQILQVVQIQYQDWDLLMEVEFTLKMPCNYLFLNAGLIHYRQ